MAHAEKCPTCNGSGKYCQKDYATVSDRVICEHPDCPTCHGCSGKGWVIVQDEVYIPSVWTFTESDGTQKDNTYIYIYWTSD